MLVFLPILFLLGGVICLAAAYPTRMWAYYVCSNTFGLCRYTDWIVLAMAAGIVIGYGMYRRSQMPRNHLPARLY